jgi:threonine dehydrogenase-like Zn-dependent dehydrogenase
MISPRVRCSQLRSGSALGGESGRLCVVTVHGPVRASMTMHRRQAEYARSRLLRGAVQRLGGATCGTASGSTRSGGTRRAFAERVVSRADKVFAADDLLDELAVLAEPLACAVHGMDVLNLMPGADVVMIGSTGARTTCSVAS